jgi:hypothetical protein
MPDFDSLLQHSLSTVNSGYLAAQGDLFRVVERLAEAIQRQTGTNIYLALKQQTADVKGTVFVLYVDVNPDDQQADTINIEHIKLQARGYPVLLGTYRKPINDFKASGSLDTPEDLEAHFVDLLADPDSPLIQAIGFALRQRADD